MILYTVLVGAILIDGDVNGTLWVVQGTTCLTVHSAPARGVDSKLPSPFQDLSMVTIHKPLSDQFLLSRNQSMQIDAQN